MFFPHLGFGLHTNLRSMLQNVAKVTKGVPSLKRSQRMGTPGNGWLEDEIALPFWVKRPIFRGKLAVGFQGVYY